jgi:predicted nucleic acid-binding protein
VNARGLNASHGEALRLLLARVSLLELAPMVLARALEPFPAPVRTLDALHLASALFLRAHGQHVAVATYDERLAEAARLAGLARQPLP